jgi:hypothetical protein
MARDFRQGSCFFGGNLDKPGESGSLVNNARFRGKKTASLPCEMAEPGRFEPLCGRINKLNRFPALRA